MGEDGLSVWTVYDHPTDFPDDYVARRHVATSKGSGPTGDIMRSQSLEAIRVELERMGLIRFDRAPEDHPHIIETWL
jgi:hypothetical protein